MDRAELMALGSIIKFVLAAIGMITTTVLLYLGLFKKDPYLNGGGYLMLSFHPFSKEKVWSKLDCP